MDAETRRTGPGADATHGAVADPLTASTSPADAMDVLQQKLERQQRHFEAVFSSTQDAFIFIDGCGRILSVNSGAERIFGYPELELVGKKVNILMPAPYRGEHDDYIQRYERTGEAKAIGKIRVVRGERRNGETFPIELSVCKASKSVDGDPVCYAAFIRDISEKVELQEQLVERERLAAIGTTAAKFAHEVANPLNGMLLNLRLAQRRLQRGVAVEKLPPLLDRVENQIHRLTALLREFRGMSCRQEFEFRPTAPSQLLGQLVDDYKEEWSRRSVTLECRWPDTLPVVPMDEPKMAQVMSNLCKNAIEAMDEGGGTLTLSASVADDTLLLSVADTGCGIAADFDVYEPFATTKPGGTGLGLPVVRHMIHAHGGDLRHESTPGRGSIFIVSLPLQPPPSQCSTSLPTTPR